ncbi:serine/threonine protein kinase [Streptomyces ferrugineus]|uniref:non-specific serine/threonine protein kinase n=1 Tax=Streptomyces ferrugineus TaxID=1413221 RepID=A0A7M2SM52_9ACTN|nr:serine/threonine-protein kinase [Streptomyces ferrugineus]QOV37089.1 serine/threonine protein kinase [Streptomyces ferrugineus]
MGEVFAGRYELVDPIGRGGVGAVWRAWDHRRRRYVAAKVLQQSDAHSLLRFVREQALRIDHPHVLAPASWAADDDKVLFTMDLVAGGSLVHLVGDYGPLPPTFVCTLLDQLLAGLAAVHAEGVVHRDIKPANLLLEATGTGRPRLRLSDFGIAMRLGEPRLTETNLVVGTPGYLAPEQLMGSEPDFPADLFAVGLVALYLLEGAKPDAKALVQYFTAHGTPGAPKGVPEPLWQVVASLLQPDPHARFRTATGARKALASAAELLPEPGPDDELIEIFDQLGPLPPGFAASGPLKRAPGVEGGTGGSPAQAGEGSAGSSGLTGSTGVTGSAEKSGTGQGTADTGSDGVTNDPRRRMAERTPASDFPMSDTGSFHLPLPQPTGSSPQAHTPPPQPPQAPPPLQAQAPLQAPAPFHAPPQGQAQAGGQAHENVQHHTPAHSSPYDTTHVLSSPRSRAPQYPTQPPTTPAQHQHVDTSTASYTAQSPQVPPSAPPIPQPRRRGGHRATRRAARGVAHRPGPPAKVAVPLLLFALVCYAVGFWALTRI